jgi:quercetin dioxygenase-like cupin family protein
MSLLLDLDRLRDVIAIEGNDLQWKPAPSGEGVMIAPLWGNPAEGAHGMIARYPPGLHHALHTHTCALKVVVLSGYFTFSLANEPIRKFGPGSFVWIPANVPHTSGCDDSGPCTVLHEGSGKWDRTPV